MDLLKEQEWEDIKVKINVIYDFVNNELSLFKECKEENLELHESVDELHEQISRWADKVKKLESKAVAIPKATMIRSITAKNYICENCGQELCGGKFCSNCGKELIYKKE